MTASPSSPGRLARAMLAFAGVAVAVTLVGCSADAVSPPPTAPSASDTPSTPSDDESPDPTSTATGSSNGSGGMSGDLADAMSSGNTAAIESYLTEPTRVVIAASEADMQYSAVDAVLSLDYVQPGVGAWDFDLASDIVDAYEANPSYGDFFPGDAIVGRSDTGAVVSFVPNGDRIGTIFMSIDEALITEY